MVFVKQRAGQAERDPDARVRRATVLRERVVAPSPADRPQPPLRHLGPPALVRLAADRFDAFQEKRERAVVRTHGE